MANKKASRKRNPKAKAKEVEEVVDDIDNEEIDDEFENEEEEEEEVVVVKNRYIKLGGGTFPYKGKNYGKGAVVPFKKESDIPKAFKDLFQKL